jgi:hypothetical protein
MARGEGVFYRLASNVLQSSGLFGADLVGRSANRGAGLMAFSALEISPAIRL